MAEPIIPRCHIPWQEMNIDADGNVTPCCNWKSHNNKDNPYCGNAKTETLDEIWNGPVYRKLRKHMATGDLEQAGCAKCILIVRDQESPLRYDKDAEAEFAKPETEQSAYARNLATLKQEIAAGAEVLEAKPTVLAVIPSYACNIRCVHCYQEPLRTKDMDKPALFEELLKLSDSMSFIQCGGGEPLLLPLWKEFLSHVDLDRNPYLTFATCTNATVVTAETEAKIRQFKNVNIGVSMDAGTKDVYERVRLRGKFDDVDKNFDRLAAIAKSKPASAISGSFAVMRDNIANLSKCFIYATSKGATASLSPVMAMPSDQAITCLRDAPVDLANWSAALTAAEETAKTIDLSNVIGGPAQLFRDVNDAWLRDNYLKQIGFVRQQIPWHAAERMHVEVSGTVPDEWIGVSKGKTPEQKLVVFSPASLPESSPPLYFAVLDGHSFHAKLAPGQYRVGVIARFDWPKYEDNTLLEVSGNGLIHFKSALAGASDPHVLQWGTPISSGHHDVYKAIYAFQENTNSWVSQQSGDDVPGGAFIGLDLGARPEAVSEVQVQWVAGYSTPSLVTIESSDDGNEWTSHGFYTVKTSGDRAGWWQSFDVPDAAPHRSWIVRAASRTERGANLAVMQVRFLSRH